MEKCRFPMKKHVKRNIAMPADKNRGARCRDAIRWEGRESDLGTEVGGQRSEVGGREMMVGGCRGGGEGRRGLLQPGNDQYYSYAKFPRE